MKSIFGFVSVVLFLVFVSSIIIIGCEQTAETTARLYVGGYSTAKIYVINPDLEELVSTIDLPAGSQPDWLTLNPDNTKLYFSTSSLNQIHVVDTENNTYETAVDVCSDPRGIAFTPDGSVAAVVNSNGGYDIALIDTETLEYNNDLTDTIFSVQGEGGIAIHPTQNKLYVAAYGGIDVADVEGNATVSRYYVGSGSESLVDIAIHPEGGSLCVTRQNLPDSYIMLDVNQIDGSIADDTSKPLSDSYSVGKLGITPNGQILYAPIYSDSRIDYFSSSDISTVNSVELSPYMNDQYLGARDVTFSDDSSLAFVLIDDVSDDKIVVIQTSDNSVLGTIDIPECDPRSLVYKP